MPYTPPTKAGFRAMVSRDLRDGQNEVFLAAEIDDLVNFGIVEVSRIYPVEAIEEVAIADDVDGRPIRQYSLLSREVYRVELWGGGAGTLDAYPSRYQIAEELDGADTGWMLFGGTLLLPSWLHLNDDDGSILKVFGYQERETFSIGSLDTDVAEVDQEAEMGVRLYASLTGYQRLQNDRAQFQQWLAIPGNNDISATQLDGMANTYLAQWNRHRNHMRTLRR